MKLNFLIFPPKYKGKHSLGAWGERLNVKKINFEGADKYEEMGCLFRRDAKVLQKEIL